MPRVTAVQQTIEDHPKDPTALGTFGEWYAFRGRNDWAIDFLERARVAGADISNLMLGRCYWEENQLPKTQVEYEAAIAKSTDDRERFYLGLCLGAIRRSQGL